MSTDIQRLAALLERAWDEETVTENPWPLIAERLLNEGVILAAPRSPTDCVYCDHPARHAVHGPGPLPPHHPYTPEEIG